MTKQQRSWLSRLEKAHELLCDVAREMDEQGMRDGAAHDAAVNAHCAAAEAVETLKSEVSEPAT